MNKKCSKFLITEKNTIPAFFFNKNATISKVSENIVNMFSK